MDAQRCYVHSTLPRRFQVGMWNDVRLTKHRLQIRASDIKVHNPRLNVQLLNVWSKFHRKVIISYYTHRVVHALAVMKVAKLNILFTAWRLGGSWKPVLQHVPCHISRILPGRTWRQTSHAAAGLFLPSQATDIVHCVSAISCHTAD